MARLGSLDGKPDGEMGLANPRRTQQHDVLRPPDEAKGAEFTHHLAVDRGLEGVIARFVPRITLRPPPTARLQRTDLVIL